MLASILNLVLSSESTAARTHLVRTGGCYALVRLANRIYLPAEPPRTDEQPESPPPVVDRNTRAIVASWAWKSVLAILETDSSETTDVPFPEGGPEELCAALQHFSRAHPVPAPSLETMEEDLEILHSATTAIGLVCTSPSGIPAYVQLLRNETDAGRWLTGFVEDGDVVPGWEALKDSDSEAEDTDPNLRQGEKELGKAKATVMTSLAELSASEQLQLFAGDGCWFGSTLMRWLHSPREDLVDCALMCLGNYVNTGTLVPRRLSRERSLRTSGR